MKKVRVFSHYFCPACRRLKDFLRKQNVPFEYVDLDRLSGESREIHKKKARRLSGSWSIPVVQVDDDVRVGFDPEWLAKVLDLPSTDPAQASSLIEWEGDPALEPRREALRMLFEPVARALGYKFTPQVEEAEMLLEQEVRNEAEFGMPFCPCKMLSGERDRDLRIVCPCIPFHRKHFDSMKRCWCGLFVHESVGDPESLKQAPED